MEIVKRNITDLKPLKCSPIAEERYHNTPLVIINENNEIVFGNYPNSSPLMNENGELTCILIPSTELESKKLSFDLHYLGMTGIIDYDNFNNMPTSKTGAPYDLFLWNSAQFEQKVAEQRYTKKHTDDSLLF